VADYSFTVGMTASISDTVQDEDNGGFKNLAGATITWQMWNRSGTALITKGVGSGITVDSAAGGQFTVTLNHADTASLTAGSYPYTCVVVDAAGAWQKVTSGTIILLALVQYTTVDPTSSLGQVRLLVPDRDSSNLFYSDDEINGFLSIEASNVKRAAALALETMASNEAYVQKVTKLLDLQTNGAATAKSLMDRAARLREQADNEEAWTDGGAFDIAEQVQDDFSARERLWKQYQRQGMV
jgi:hypothetical protein